VVQRYVLDRLDRVDAPNLRVYMVWGPMLGGEKAEDAREATALIPDPRATHYWTGSHTLAELLRGAAGLKEELAWDTFLLFPPEGRWGDLPPPPAYVMHVNKRSLPPERRLNGDKLFEQVKKLLAH
jgi:hypothetical protein